MGTNKVGELERQRIQYKDFSEWQNVYMKSDEMHQREKYWVEKFSDELPILNMPLDYPRPAIQEFSGQNINIQINKELNEKIRAVAKETGATTYMVLCTSSRRKPVHWHHSLQRAAQKHGRICTP